MTYFAGFEYPTGVFFKDRNGDLADPTTVTLTIKQPGGATTTYTYGVGQTIIKDAVGTYAAYIVCGVEGRWRGSWKATGSLVAVLDVEWVVEPSLVAAV